MKPDKVAPAVVEENHVNDVEPEVASPEVTNHAASEPEDGEIVSDNDEAADNNNSSRSQSQIKLKYDYKDGNSFASLCSVHLTMITLGLSVSND